MAMRIAKRSTVDMLKIIDAMHVLERGHGKRGGALTMFSMELLH